MRQSLLRRKQAVQNNKVETPSPSTSMHPGYAPDAALHAIKRHALEFVNPKELQVSKLECYKYIFIFSTQYRITITISFLCMFYKNKLL